MAFHKFCPITIWLAHQQVLYPILHNQTFGFHKLMYQKLIHSSVYTCMLLAIVHITALHVYQKRHNSRYPGIQQSHPHNGPAKLLFSFELLLGLSPAEPCGIGLPSYSRKAQSIPFFNCHYRPRPFPISAVPSCVRKSSHSHDHRSHHPWLLSGFTSRLNKCSITLRPAHL